jgi:hypothetical protein
LLILGVLVIAGVAILVRRPSFSMIGHQRPYKWDQFVIPRMEFTQEPVSNVVKAVNDAVRAASRGTVEQAVMLDATPASVRKFAPNPEIDRRMDAMISVFRQHEQEMLRNGANGYESAFFTGQMGGGHSLGCTFQELVTATGLGYEERADGISVWREPRYFECRAYRISNGLLNLMEQKRRANHLHVDAEPIVSALAQATGIHSWSITVPDGPNSWHDETRFDKVFQPLPDLGLILALGTPEEHATAEARLKASGLWADVAAEMER